MVTSKRTRAYERLFREREFRYHVGSEGSWACGMIVVPEVRQERRPFGREERQVEAKPSSTGGPLSSGQPEATGVSQQGGTRWN